MSGHIVALGEIMLRLKAPGFERFLQTSTFETTFGGGESNVAISLAQFGSDVAFVTALPQNPIGDECIRFLRSYGINTSYIVRGGERIGIYFLERGANQRPSKVIYDRTQSSIATVNVDAFDWDGIFEGAAWFHITGITPALSENTAILSLKAVQAAHKHGVTVSCDYNFRKNLWQYGKSAPEVMIELVKYVDVIIANENDCQVALGINLSNNDWQHNVESGQSNIARSEALARMVFEAFPNLKYHAITLRESFSASHNGWAACLFDGETFFLSQRYDITDIVDRIGGGDSFAAGLIYGLSTRMPAQEALDFAVAASCLKHSISGDVNRITTAEVEYLKGGDASEQLAWSYDTIYT